VYSTNPAMLDRSFKFIYTIQQFRRRDENEGSDAVAMGKTSLGE